MPGFINDSGSGPAGAQQAISQNTYSSSSSSSSSSTSSSSSSSSSAPSVVQQQARFSSGAATETFQLTGDGTHATSCWARQIQSDESVEIAPLPGNTKVVYFTTDGNPLNAVSGKKGQLGVGANPVRVILANLLYLAIFATQAGEGITVTIRKG